MIVTTRMRGTKGRAGRTPRRLPAAMPQLPSPARSRHPARLNRCRPSLIPAVSSVTFGGRAGRCGVSLSFTSVLVVAAIAFLAPLLLGLLPRAPLPAVVLELVGGILVGPSVLDWAKVDAPVRTLSLLGLAFLRLLEVAGLGFVLSFGIALAIGFAFDAAGLVRSPLLVAVMLSATSLGVVIPVLKDAGEGGSQLGQLVLAGATIADVATIVLLSLFFSAEAGSTTSRAILLGGFVLLSAAVAFALVGAERLRRLTDALVRLQDTTAQIRVRGAFLLLAAF